MLIALTHAGPTVIARGSEAHKAFHLPRILKGESLWCQGFSEPGAGSDLANVQVRGVVDGDELVVTGQKTWTSGAMVADFQELLAAFTFGRAELVRVLRTLSPEDWQRTGLHEAQGRITIQETLRHLVEHEAEHCVQIETLLG